MAKRKRSTSTLPRPNPAAPGTGTDGPATKAERRDQARQEREGPPAEAGAKATRPWPGDSGGDGVRGPRGGGRCPAPHPVSLPQHTPGPGLRRLVGEPGDPARHPDRAGSVAGLHQHLDLYVNGTKQVSPAQIGIIASPQVVFSPLHTHDTSGIIHVESPTVRSVTLGEFFDVWGVRLTPTCVGGYCTQSDRALRVYVDGQLATGDPTTLELFAHEEIVVTYRTEAELPDPIPSSYTSPPGL